jgi:hypothetical protein
MDLLRELSTEYDDVVPLTEALNEAVRELRLQKRGGVVKNTVRNASSFFRANPALTIGAATLALSAYSSYKKNKRNTLRLFAKDPYEKKMMTDVADMLTKSGKYALKKTKYADGGKYWELKRTSAI